MTQTEGLLYLANEKAKATDKGAISTAIHVVAKYKVLDDFMNDIIEARAIAYIIEFTNCKNKVV